MRTYWDTSAVINAAVSTAVFDHLENGEHVTRLHTMAEFFSTMTGRGVTDSVALNPPPCSGVLALCRKALPGVISVSGTRHE